VTGFAPLVAFFQNIKRRDFLIGTPGIFSSKDKCSFKTNLRRDLVTENWASTWSRNGMKWYLNPWHSDPARNGLSMAISWA
jgi:hypothetical protein